MQTWQVLIVCGLTFAAGFCLGVGYALRHLERRGLSAEHPGQKQNLFGDFE